MAALGAVSSASVYYYSGLKRHTESSADGGSARLVEMSEGRSPAFDVP